MGFILLFVLILLGMLFPKSKIICGLVCVYTWILYGCNTYSGDYLNYLNVYVNISSLYAGVEPGYAALTFLCSLLHFSFTGFRMVLATIYVVLLYLVVKRYTKMPALAMALLAFFPAGYFLSVLRSGIAGVVALYSLRYLEKENKEYSITKYAIGVLIALSFHRSAILFLVFLFAGRKITLKKKCLIFIATIAVAYIYLNTDFLLSVVKLFTSNSKVWGWFNTALTQHPNIKGIIVALIIVAFILISGSYAARRNSHNRIYLLESLFSNAKGSGMIRNVLQTSFIFIPFVFFADSYMRLFYTVLPLAVCACTNAVHYEKNTFRRIIAYCLAIALPLVAFLYSDLPYIGTVNDGLDVFRNNLVFGLKFI